MSKFRVLVCFPIGLISVGRPKELVDAMQSLESLREKLGGKTLLALVPDCRQYRVLDAERDAEDAALAASDPVYPPGRAIQVQDGTDGTPKTYVAHPSHSGPLVTSKEQLAAALAEAERRYRQQDRGDEVPWLLERVCVIVTASLAWCWWRCRWIAGQDPHAEHVRR